MNYNSFFLPSCCNIFFQKKGGVNATNFLLMRMMIYRSRSVGARVLMTSYAGGMGFYP